MKITDPNLLPEHIKRMIGHAQRHALGIVTNEERSHKVERYNERKLHSQIRQLLGLKGIAYLEMRMDRRSHATVGWPDFTFCVPLGPDKSDPTNNVHVAVPCAWECKVDGRKPTTEQVEMHLRMIGNGWRVRIIRSLKEAADELKALGL